jgi:hypothetical protein
MGHVDENFIVARIRRVKVAKRNLEYHIRLLNRDVEDYYADHWRDDDHPAAELTLGTRRQAA